MCPPRGIRENVSVARLRMAPAGQFLAVQGGERRQGEFAALDLLPEPGAVALDDLLAGAMPADQKWVPPAGVRRSMRTVSPCSSAPSKAARRSGRSLMLTTLVISLPSFPDFGRCYGLRTTSGQLTWVPVLLASTAQSTILRPYCSQIWPRQPPVGSWRGMTWYCCSTSSPSSSAAGAAIPATTADHQRRRRRSLSIHR